MNDGHKVESTNVFAKNPSTGALALGETGEAACTAAVTLLRTCAIREFEVHPSPRTTYFSEGQQK